MKEFKIWQLVLLLIVSAAIGFAFAARVFDIGGQRMTATQNREDWVAKCALLPTMSVKTVNGKQEWGGDVFTDRYLTCAQTYDKVH